MKPTKENLIALRKMGFQPEDEDLMGWWTRDGWAFLMDNMPSIKILVERLIRYHYTVGYNDGEDKVRKRFSYRDL
jgi:hypothetical protein